MAVKLCVKLQDTAVHATATSNLVEHGVGRCYVTIMGKKLLKKKRRLNLEQYQKLLK